MRVSIVPAQITTVEDKIVGNISVQQATLLGIPILFGFIAAILFPPSGQFVTYKLVLVAIVFVICGSLAIRIRGRIVAKWIGILAIYCSRPRYYVYDKNNMYLREDQIDITEEDPVVVPVRKRPKLKPVTIAPREFARLEQLALDARSGIKFEVGKKGKLNVRITEVK